VNTPTNTQELFYLYKERGDEPYGEAITQTEHALQCAALARAEGASDAMIIAALFHDVGHLVVEIQNEPGFKMDEDDDDHEAIGARVLAPLFGPSVAGPVALHVTAKRWR
jgi:predicted HD phosphohydrolase